MKMVRRAAQGLGTRLAEANGKVVRERYPFHHQAHSERVAAAYMAQPATTVAHGDGLDAVSHLWLKLATEINFQYRAIQEFARVLVVDEDPYTSYDDLSQDLDTGWIQVWHSKHTGGHPVWADSINNQFRAVHDVMGHYRNGFDFTANGEDAAYRSHAETLSDAVTPALAIETRAQTSAFWYAEPFQTFKVQKAFIPPAWMYVPFGWRYGL